MAMALVSSGTVTKDGDDTLLLTYFLKTGVVLPQDRGKGKILKAANTKRTVSQALQVAEAEVPAIIDGSERLVAELAFPPRGFTRTQFAEQEEKVKEVVQAYEKVGRHDAAHSLRSWIAQIAQGFESSELESAQIVKECPGVAESLAAVVSEASAVVREDASGKARILFNVGDAMLKPNGGFVKVVSSPANRSRQIFDLLEKSKDLREKWDEKAPGEGLKSYMLVTVLHGSKRADQFV